MSDQDYRFRQYAGGCQCGAVRFRATELVDNPHICHCRMCQKAVGNLFASLVGVRHEHLTWTRGTPATFMSSDHVARGFCSACGTPLYYRDLRGEHVSMSIGAFDTPHQIPLRFQSGLEGRHPALLHLQTLASRGTTEGEQPARAAAIAASNRQHPDCESAAWRLEGSGQ